MVKKEKIRDILKVLKKYPKLKFRALRKIVVEEEGLMSPQTFATALKEGVESKVITREPGHYKNRKIVEYSLPEYSKAEDDYYQNLISSIDLFENKLEILKKKFPKFNDVKKGQVLFLFSDWLNVIASRIGFGLGVFQSSKFGDLLITVNQTLNFELIRLTMIGGPQRQRTIMNEFFLGWNDIEQDNAEEIDEFLGIANETK